MKFSAIRAVLASLKPYPWIIPSMVLLGTIASLAEGVGIGLFIPLLTYLLHTGSRPGGFPLLNRAFDFFSAHSNVDRLLVVGGFIFTLYLIKSCLLYFTASLSASITARVNHDMRTALFRRMLTVDYDALISDRQGRFVNAFEVQAYRAWEAMSGFFAAISNLCTIAAFATLLLLISWKLTFVVALAAAAASALIGLPLVHRVRRLGDALILLATEMTQRALNSLGGMRVIRAFGQEEQEERRFEDASNKLRAVAFRMDRMTRMIPTALEAAYAPIFLGVIVGGQYLSIGIPTLAAYLLLLYRIQPQIRSFDQQRAQFAGNSGAVLELAALAGSEQPRHPGTVAFEGLREGISFRGVSLKYQSGTEVRRALSSISLDLKSRKMTAIVGASGAGKTSLINLLYGLYEPSEGEILVDGIPLQALDVSKWRARLALAGQDAPLLDGSVLDNIRFGDPEADLDAVVDAAKLAAAHEFISAFPNGYATEVGDRGVRLSEGQRQRIGLARALLRKPDILILDEATNAVDAVTEQAIRRALERLAHRITLIVIAHRLDTIRMADHVIVLGDGGIVEQGPPGDLLASDGSFARIHALQGSVEFPALASVS